MANYTAPVRFSVVNTYGNGPVDEDDVYTVEEFQALCREGAFIDSDGCGHPVRDSRADTDFWVTPSDPNDMPPDATHVVWYNR